MLNQLTNPLQCDIFWHFNILWLNLKRLNSMPKNVPSIYYNYSKYNKQSVINSFNLHDKSLRIIIRRSLKLTFDLKKKIAILSFLHQLPTFREINNRKQKKKWLYIVYKCIMITIRCKYICYYNVTIVRP